MTRGSHKTTTAPASEPITLTEAKAHLRVDFDDDDTLITAMIAAARGYVEEHCNRALLTQTVTQVIAGQIGWTVLLGLVSLVIAVVIGNLLGILAAWRRGGILDSVLPPVLIFIGSFPYFWLAMGLLWLFGVTLGWFPLRHAFSVGSTPEFSLAFIGDVALHLVLPAASIVLVSIGGWMLGMRNTMISTNAEDYIVMAEAKGLRPGHIMMRYAARNALLPSVTAFGMSLGFIVGGALLTEVVFAYPGVGYQLLSAVQNLDYPLMQGLFLTITTAVLVANFLVDIVYVRLDPRVRVS
jgi:peptide/nickel transport system permease protein